MARRLEPASVLGFSVPWFMRYINCHFVDETVGRSQALWTSSFARLVTISEALRQDYLQCFGFESNQMVAHDGADLPSADDGQLVK